MYLRDYRLAKNMTQQQLADAIGVNVGTISKYENGINTPSKRKMERLCEVLDVSVDTLMIEDTPFGHLQVDISNNKSAMKRMQAYASVLNQYFRSAIILGAQCKCELCGCDAPFKDLKDRPYLDIYIIDKTETKEDSYKNVVALCPNCYRKVDVRKDPEDIDLLKKKASKHNY